ncbi:hypothetical protein ABT246_40625 [Streptomyces sp. NPDC001553]|uniref:hypothetical protein n=1 Tax=Streptomyces sp. NPDC001553 TaxID=3154385 RepID=UPI00331F614C
MSWDLPASVSTPGGIFNSPGTGVSVTGKRPGRAAGLTRWADLRERLDRARDGSVTTPSFTIGHGAGQAVTAVVVELDWKNDGKAPVRYVFHHVTEGLIAATTHARGRGGSACRARVASGP